MLFPGALYYGIIAFFIEGNLVLAKACYHKKQEAELTDYFKRVLHCFSFRLTELN